MKASEREKLQVGSEIYKRGEAPRMITSMLYDQDSNMVGVIAKPSNGKKGHSATITKKSLISYHVLKRQERKDLSIMGLDQGWMDNIQYHLDEIKINSTAIIDMRTQIDYMERRIASLEGQLHEKH